MKRILSLILTFTIVLFNVIPSFAAGSEEAVITLPGQGEWLDPYEKITVKWSTPSSGMNYRITIKNDVTGTYIVENKAVSGNSYTIASNTLDFEQRYKIWVGTYSGSTSVGRGDSITVNINDRYSSKKVYEEATFSYPKNNQEVSADSDLKITLNGNSDLAYWLTVKDETTGKIIADEENLTSTTYTLKKSLLTEGHSYKAWVGTFKKASVEKRLFGAGNTVYFSVEEESFIFFDAAEITSPSNLQWLDPTNDITVKWSQPATSLEYCISINNDSTGEYIVKNKYTNSNSYTIPKNTLEEQQRYKISLITYAGGSKVGSTDNICFNTNDVDYTEAYFSSPSDGDAFDADEKITVRFSDLNSEFRYRISIVDNETGKSLTKNELISGNSYTINAGTLESGKEYKLWVGTYLSGDSDTSLGKGDVIYININDEEINYDAAGISFPKNGYSTESGVDVEIKWNNAGDELDYSISILDCETGEYVVENKSVSKNTYVITGSKLTAGHRYEISLTTYLESDVVGSTDKVYFDVLNDAVTPETSTSPSATREAEFISPSNDDVIDSEEALTISWRESDIDTCYSLTVEDLTVDEYLVKNKILTDTEYTIEAYDLYAAHRYRAQIKTYSNTSLDKEVIGNGDEIEFETKSKAEEIFDEEDAVIEKTESYDDDYYESGQNNSVNYYDVPSYHSNYEAIQYLSGNNVLNGYGDGSFKPNATITRAEFVKVVCEAFHLKSYGSHVFPSFADTNNHWAEKYIDYAASRNLINGMGNGIFAPNDNVTYQHVAKIITVLKAMDDNVTSLGGYPGGYLKVAYYNGFLHETTVDTKTLQSDEFYNKNATRADVAQIVYNAIKHDGVDKTPSVGSITDSYDDIGNAYENPTPQQIYNFAYNRIKNREIYEKAPEVLNAIMTMIWAENGGKHYDNYGKVLVSSTNDYGICQLNGSKYKDLNWHENAEIGIDKYAVAYYACMTETTYKNTVNKGVNKGYSLAESRARTAYCMYNGGNGAHSRWVDTGSNQDSNFKSKWDSKTWENSVVVISGNGNPIDQTLQTNLIDSLSESDIYIKQAKSNTCTLASMVMIFRRRAILDNNEYWWMIRENTMEEQGNWPDGLSNNTKYENYECGLDLKGSKSRINYSVNSSDNPILNKNASAYNTINIIKKYLDEHPEGIVLYVMESGGGWQHAVALTGYDGNEFYCADPANSKYAGRELNLMDSSLVDSNHANTQSVEELFSNCVAIWYVISH